MSVSLQFVRLSNSNQVNFDVLGQLSTRTYCLIEIGTGGWPSGARNRVKRLAIESALPYVNKLHMGKWIDDGVYRKMYTIVDSLIRERAVFRSPGFLPTDLSRELAEGSGSVLSGWEDLPVQFDWK